MITDPLVETQTRDLSANPVVISVEGLKKSFNIPLHRVESFKERTVHPLRKTEYRELKALDGIDFEVRKGEFFGIVGRNGSGKSTLLKILASIYRADAGSVKMAGRLAPFIELGVGFNHDLTAHDNVIMNGVMMGLSRQEAAARLDRVVEFAELDDFVDTPYKHLSSGMKVRLAFAVISRLEEPIILVDEVLAVGDAEFQ
ncbi:MAG: ABC transporter ATP-binding protein, partial [Solirubrobacterales bacterium]|nr:ABC transporter ATP-binding protein [Solirubrobacterales bacterium]